MTENRDMAGGDGLVRSPRAKSARYFTPNEAYAGLGRASIRGGLILMAGRGLNVIAQLLSTIILARYLSPNDFGLVAILNAIVLFAPVFIDLGTTDAATQKTKITHEEISTLFWMNVAIGIVLTCICAASSGLIAEFFSQPELQPIALMMSPVFLLSALSVQHYALMRRAMEFRSVSTIDLAANAISSLVAVIMAVTDWGFWSLAAKPVIQAALTACGAWLACRWVPGAPRVSDGVRELVRFGMGVTGFTFMDTISKSADKVALGYFGGPSSLGYFQNASVLYGNVLSLISEAMHNVGVASLSKLRNDMSALRRSWSAALSLLTLFSTVSFAVLAVSGKDLTVLLLGQKWAAAGPLLSVFAIRGIAASIERTMGWLHVVSGQSDRWMRWGVFSTVVHLVALSIGLPYGAMGVAVAYTAAMFLLFVPSVAYAGRPLGIGARDVLAATAPQIVSAITAAAAGFYLQHLMAGSNTIMRMLATASATVLVYATLMLVATFAFPSLRNAFGLMFRNILPVTMATNRSRPAL